MSEQFDDWVLIALGAVFTALGMSHAAVSEDLLTLSVSALLVLVGVVLCFFGAVDSVSNKE
jgi:EamA domain-containing membrane protein RarD